MDHRFVSFYLCFPCTLLLPSAVRQVNHSFDAPASFGFWLGVLGIVGCVALLERGLLVAEEIWDEEVRRHPPDWPGAVSNPIRLLCRAIVVLTQASGLLTYATTMDGGVMFAATRWVYLVYLVPALALLVGRWKVWTLAERLFLRWGWAPILAFGVPIALPELRATGWIRGPLD